MTHPDDLSMKLIQHPDGFISDIQITRGKTLYRLPWWRRWLAPWRRYRLSCQPSAPSRVEGVGELALELELMANRAADDSRFGDAHFLFRAAHILKRRHHSSSAEGKAQS